MSDWQPPQYDPRQHQQRIGGPQYPPPGYGQPPYGQYRPAPRRSWPRRHKVLTGFLSLCALFLVIGIAAATGGNPSSSLPPVPTQAAVAASHAASSPAARQAVTYVVTGSPADVTYGPAGSSLTGTVPMHVSRPLGSPSYYSLQAQLQGSGTVTCAIEVDGRVISRATASGQYQVAMCEISQDPFSGGWQDDNSA